mgnify:CR=1 FL=1
MFFKQLPTKESLLSYFFGCAGHAIAAAVDVVAGDEDWFIEQAAQANVRIAYVFDTHADHFSGGRELAKRVGAHYCLHESARSFMKFDYEPLVDGRMLHLGNVKVLHPPGHTIDRDSFVRELTTKIPARPANMDQIVASNIAA